MTTLLRSLLLKYWHGSHDSHVLRRGRGGGRGGGLSVLGLLGSVAAVSAVAASAVLEDGRLECSLPDLLSVAQLRDPRLLKSGDILNKVNVRTIALGI